MKIIPSTANHIPIYFVDGTASDKEKISNFGIPVSRDGLVEVLVKVIGE